MIQPQLDGMEGLASQGDRQLATAAVGGIAHNRMAPVGAMHPDLVGAPRIQLETQQRVVPQTLYQAPVGAGGSAAGGINHRIFLAIHRVAADWPIDAARLPQRHPVNHRQVFAAGDALLNLALQPHQGLLAFGDDNAAGCVLIEPMHDARAHLAADAGQVGAMVQQAIHQGAVLVAGGRMHGEASGLVDHNQVGVLVQHIKGDRLRFEIGKRFGGRHPQLHLIAGPEGGFGTTGDAVHPHKAGVDELLNPGAALLGTLTHQPAVQTHRQRFGVMERQPFAFTFAECGHGLQCSTR